MSDYRFSDEELRRYFGNARERRRGRRSEHARGGLADNASDSFMGRMFDTPEKMQAAKALGTIAGVGFLGLIVVLIYFLTFSADLPDISQIENPQLQLATVAYTADGIELQRYARQNRSWVNYSEIAPVATTALVATEDHRFHNHWGIDLFRTLAVPYHLMRGSRQGGSTISQQLARNLYNEQIGKEVSIKRKLKEMVTAVQLEKRYSKPEIIEMYLNTVEFGNNAFGIDAAARTFFGKKPIELDTLESATLVGMLKAISRFNPVRNPENARGRRNVVLGQMVKHGVLPESYLVAERETPVTTAFNSSDITAGIAPHFAEFVRNWLTDWCRDNGCDPYSDGLVVYTTLDSGLQELAEAAVREQMKGLQAVVDYDWSRATTFDLATSTAPYLEKTDYEPFEYFWKTEKELATSFLRESRRYKALRKDGKSDGESLKELRENESFMDSLRSAKTRLEAGFVSLDPRNGHVKAWVGGRDLSVDWYDHVAIAKRQPGSTFKPFVYTAAIDNGYSPYHVLKDTTFLYVDAVGNEWSPMNSGDPGSGEYMTLREGLAHSKNTITGQLVQLVGAKETAHYARLMGIESSLAEVPALALGVSDVSLLELTSAYSTLAYRGLYNKPAVVTRIEDKHGIVIYESKPKPTEALSENTAIIMVDMLRDVIREGTGRRLNTYRIGSHDIAGKTGTTQNNSDGWFIGMHPELVSGAWVGFNDRRISIRSDWWGQGAHNAMFIVGDFLQRALNDEEAELSDERFPTPTEYGLPLGPLDPSDQRERDKSLEDKDNRMQQGRVGW